MSARRKVSFVSGTIMLQFETEAVILQTAEIISLLYEATQGPQLPTEPPVLNPTGGVTGKKPVVLNYKKDPTRPGGGVFVAPGKVSDYDLPEGVVVSGSSDGEGSDAEGAIPCHRFGSSTWIVLMHIYRKHRGRTPRKAGDCGHGC